MLAMLGIYGIQDAGDFQTPCWTHDHGVALILEQMISERVLPLSMARGSRSFICRHKRSKQQSAWVST